MPDEPGVWTSCSGVENEFDPVPFEAEAARIFGRVTAAVIAAARKARGRVADLMIAASPVPRPSPGMTATWALG
jgi:predicted nucleic acid-binding protein